MNFKQSFLKMIEQGTLSYTGNQEDIQKIMECAKQQKLVPFVYPIVRQYMEKELASDSDELMQNHKKKVNNYIKEIETIIQLLKKTGIRFTIVKGIPLSQLIYGSPYMRHVGDIDVLVEKEDFEATYNILKTIGYIQWIDYNEATGEFIKSENLQLKYKKDFYEYQCVKETQHGMIFLEVKRETSAIKGALVDEFMKSRMGVQIGNCKIECADLEFTLIHLLMNIFANAETTQMLGKKRKFFLRDYVDVLYFLRKYKDKVNYKKFILIIKKYDITQEINRSVYEVRTLFPEEKSLAWFEALGIHDTKFDLIISDGTLYAVNWKSDIIRRIFDLEFARKEYIVLYKQAHLKYAKQSKTNKKFYVNHKREKELSSFAKCTMYASGESVDIFYQIIIDSDSINIILALDNTKLKKIENYILSFVFIDLNLQSKTIFRSFDISLDLSVEIKGKYVNDTILPRTKGNVNDMKLYSFSIKDNEIKNDVLCLLIELYKVYDGKLKQRQCIRYEILKQGQ